MKKYISLLIMSILFLSNTTYAGPINGEISISGSSTTTANMAGNKAESVVFGSAFVGVVTGDFITEGVKTIFDVGIDPSSTVVLSNLNPVQASANFWSILGFSFDLGSITQNHIIGNVVTIAGNGIIKHNNYDDTVYDLLLSSQSGGQTTFSARLVPAPTGAVLLVLALLAFGLTRRYNKIIM